MAVYDHVQHAVLEQEFRFLEALRQLLADRVLDHSRPREADQGARLGDRDIAQHGVGSGDPARGRVGQHDDIGQSLLAHRLHRDRGPRHLHQRKDTFLHAGAAGGGDDDQSGVLEHRQLRRPEQRGAGRHPHRAAEKLEVLHRHDRRMAADQAMRHLDRVLLAGLSTAFFLLFRSKLWPGRRSAIGLESTTDDRHALILEQADAEFRTEDFGEVMLRHGAAELRHETGESS